MKVTEDYVFFWKGWLSNFWRAPFIAEWQDGSNPLEQVGVNPSQPFFCTEQYFMFMKACTFKDWEIAKKILKTTMPQEAKKLGQQVRGYKDDIWSAIRQQVMYDANWCKYTQNQDLKDKLLNPDWDGKHLVEASPYDRIWAVGLEETDPRILDPTQWRGQNLLGKVLDQVRDDLIKKEGRD